MLRWSIYFLTLILTLADFGELQSQEKYHIAIINDDETGFAPIFRDQIQREISDLLGPRTDLRFSNYYLNNNEVASQEMIEGLYEKGDIDIILGTGLIASSYLAHREPYSIPTISGVVVDRALLNLPFDNNGASGVDNYTYIQTPFDVEKDLKTFSTLYPFQHLGILLDTDVDRMDNVLKDYFRERLPEDITFELLQYDRSLDEMLEVIGDQYDALYILAFANEDEDQVKSFYHELNHRKIPTFSLTGREQVRLGAMAGLAPSDYVLSLIRRMALNVMYIYEGQNPSGLSTSLLKKGEDFVINMQTLKHLDIYPDFDLLNQAILLDLEVTEGDQSWSISSYIYEALKTNLNFLSVQQEPLIADQDVTIAKSNLKPQLEVGTVASIIDPTRVDLSMGQAADVSWLANATLNQVIYNEPAMANVAIQKLLRRQQDEIVRQSELDVILDAATAYLTYLQAQRIVRIQNENVDVTNQNLNISESKEALGYSGISDVYRLQTQLSQNVIDLNQAVSNLNQARIRMNQLVNRQQREEFNIEDIDNGTALTMAANPTLATLINNQRDLNKLTDFFVQRCFEKLPELKQLEYAIQAQDRSLLSSRRSLFLPKVNLQATADQPIQYFGTSVGPGGTSFLTKDLQWGITAQAAIPIFQGGFRKATIQKDQVSLEQLRLQEQDLKNVLELQLRSSMEILSASFQKVALSREAADYSIKNFNIIQDLYRQGQANIITLIDAQNASLIAELNANNALYQLVIDFLSVERATGGFYFLMEGDEKTEFERELMNAILSN